MTGKQLTGCRVLIVEDETMIALMIEDTLTDLGCEIVGPTGDLEQALRLANEGAPDIAILDVSIRGGKVYPVAERLLACGIPFVLASGYGDWALPENLRDQTRLMKPFTTAQLEKQVKELYERAAGKA